jgi:hypothetical protein
MKILILILILIFNEEVIRESARVRLDEYL